MSITNYLNKIKTAVYGKDVRGAIHDAIKQVYDDASVNHDNANMEVKLARGTHTTLNDRLDKSDEIQAQTNARLSQSINYVTYEMFGAKSDGEYDDGIAIKLAHEYANENNLPIKADGSKTYYIKSTSEIEIKTNVNWNGATIVIDDSDITTKEERLKPVFVVAKTNQTISLDNTSDIVINTDTTSVPKLGGHGFCLVWVENSNKKHFIRKGANANSGSNQQEMFVVDNSGNLLVKANEVFDNITSVVLYPISDNKLIIENGNFIHKLNNNSSYSYFERGICVEEHHVTIKNITHNIHLDKLSSPYFGFIHGKFCYDLKVEDCVLPPLSIYLSSNNVSMGTYQLRLDNCVNVILNHIEAQALTTDKWGFMSSNYSKNVTFLNSNVNRIDAHEGIRDLTVKDTIVGCRGLTLIGWGTLLMENVKVVNAESMVILRNDYGSNWNGKIIIKNCEFYGKDTTSLLRIVDFNNDGTHDFGYICHHPELKIDGLVIHDEKTTTSRTFLISNNSSRTGDVSSSTYLYPYLMPEYLSFKNIHSTSGKGFVLMESIKNSVGSRPGSSKVTYEPTYTDSDVLKKIEIDANITIEIDNVDFYGSEVTYYNKSNLFTISDDIEYNDTFYDLKTVNPLIPKIIINNCKNVFAGVGANVCEVHLSNCDVRTLIGSMSGSKMKGSAINCRFSPLLNRNDVSAIRVNYFDFPFIHCEFDYPYSKKFGVATKDDLIKAYSHLKYLTTRGTNYGFVIIPCYMTDCTHKEIDINLIEPSYKNFNLSTEMDFANNIIPAKSCKRANQPLDTDYPIPNGHIVYIVDENKVEMYNNGTWIVLNQKETN